MDIIARAVDDFPKRLRRCIEASGGANAENFQAVVSLLCGGKALISGYVSVLTEMKSFSMSDGIRESRKCIAAGGGANTLHRHGVQRIEEEFIELAFSEAACGKQPDASLRGYHLAVTDTRPRTSTSLITLFYASLYHQKLQNSWYFLIEKGNDGVTPDLRYSEEAYTIEVNGIQRSALEEQGIDALFENPSAREQFSLYPVVFVLFKKPTAAMEHKKVTEACETISYCIRGSEEEHDEGQVS
ncbi:hypothetical protein ANCDUO_20128 [Ancylostoma duodenale]|uniref:Uncharacterized protein n=1 Tax=Ancylostoma duodenale TaxID=51022 RepID=A0A0C2FY70_9BILA|nr:hypothetical protein ANCDUO_20128 [Ancylostoma duodenale]